MSANPEDYIDDFESSSDWDSAADVCDLCGDSAFKLLCRTASANVCAVCAEAIFKKKADNAEIAAWHYSRIHNALAAPEGNRWGALRWRLTVLWRYKEAESLFVKQPSSDVSKLRRLLVANLGFITQHPMDNAVRQAAYQACVSAGKTILPFLLARKNVTKPWKLYANIVLSAGKIAPDQSEVRCLLEEASQHANPNVRGRVAAAIMTHDSPWAAKMLKRLKDDPNPRVREFIAAENEQMPLFKPLSAQKGKPKSHVKKFKSKESERIDALESVSGTLILKVVDRCYTKSILKTIYNVHLAPFYGKDDFDIKGVFSLNKLRKTQLVRAFAYILSNREKLREMVSRMPSGVKRVLDTLVWEGGERHAQSFDKPDLDPPVIIYKKEKKFGPHIKEVGYLNPAYQFFPFHSDYHYSSGGIYYDYYLGLPDELRKLFKSWLPPPPEYHLSGLDTASDTDFIYEDRDRILSRIELFCAYIDQGNLKYSKNGEKVLKTSLKQMAKYCDISEFYDLKDKDLGVLKTSLIIDFLQCYRGAGRHLLKKSVASAKSQSPLFLKHIFSAFFKDTPKYGGYYLNRLLSHLKGVHNLKSGYHEQSHRQNERTVRESLAAVLKKIPAAGDSYQWISVPRLIKYCLYRDIDLHIANRSFASRYLSFDSQRDSSIGYHQVYISSSIYNDAVMTPFVKGVLFLFASFGIADIAYDTPENNRLCKKGSNYLSVFDGLKYVRLTRLGAYVIGQTDIYAGYEKTSTAESQGARIVLDDKRLLIRLEGQDRLKAMVLDKLSEKVSDDCYKATFQSFLKECASQKDIHAKIKLFKEHVSSDPPLVWKDFLNSVVSKIDPLSPQPDMRLFRFSASDNQELATLMVRDAVLKKYVLKAEDYHIAVSSVNLLKVKKRLEEFGYFITQLR